MSDLPDDLQPDELASMWRELQESVPSIPEAEKAVTRARGAADRAAELEALKDLASAYLLAGRSAEALSPIERMIALAKKLRDHDAEAMCYFNLAMTYRMLDRPGPLIDAGNKAVKMLKYQGRNDLLIQLLPALADAHVALMQDGKAISAYKDLIALLNDGGHNEDRAAYTLLLVELLLQGGRAEEAIAIGNDVYGDFIESRDATGQTIVCTALAAAYLESGNLDLALGAHLNAAHMGKQAGMTDAVAANLIGAGKVQFELGEGIQAAGSYAEAYTIAKQQGNSFVQAQALHGIAQYNMNEELYADAVGGLEQAAQLLENLRDQEGLQVPADLLLDVYSLLISCFKELGEDERADAVALKAEQLENALDDEE